MKKCEPGAKRSKARWALVVAIVARGALGQEVAPTGPEPSPSLVPAPPLEAPPPPPEVANPLPPPEEPGRLVRVGMALLIGGGAGALTAFGGGLIGAAAIRNEAVQPVGNVWTGAALGFALGAPVGVIFAGWLFDGDGAWWATVLGDLAGLVVGAATALLGGQQHPPARDTGRQPGRPWRNHRDHGVVLSRPRSKAHATNPTPMRTGARTTAAKWLSA